MKDAEKSMAASPKAASKDSRKAPSAMSRLKLALLDQYSARSEKSGGDPYNTNKGSPAQDQWRGNARRI